MSDSDEAHDEHDNHDEHAPGHSHAPAKPKDPKTTGTQAAHSMRQWVRNIAIGVAAFVGITFLVVQFLNYDFTATGGPIRGPGSNQTIQPTGIMYTPGAYDTTVDHCDGVIQHVTLNEDGTVINPGNFCSVSWRVLGDNNVRFSGGNSSVIVDKNGGDLGSLPVESASAVSQTAELMYALCPFGTTYHENGCSP